MLPPKLNMTNSIANINAAALSKSKPMLYKPVWEYISLEDYKKPSLPARENVRNGLISVRDWIHPVAKLNILRRKELHSIPPYLLNRVAPTPSLRQMVDALDARLTNWRLRESNKSVQLVVGPPGSEVDMVVTELALANNWQIIGAPSPKEILNGGEVWLQKLNNESVAPMVLPQLGKCYIRHQDGLVLISRLLDWLQITKRRFIIACDSWAWSYLVKALQIDVMLPMPLTLAPFDAQRCQFWLPMLASCIHKDRFVFRDIAHGNLIFPMADRYSQDMKHISQKDELYGDWVGVNYFIRQLAAYGRGVPSIVWSVWRQCLQISEDRYLNNNALVKKTEDARYTIWVKPWSKLNLPFVPTPLGTDECFILHTLLIHGGMSVDLLAEMLPLSYNEVRRILHFFEAANLLEKTETGWVVSLLGYPAVRQFLAHEGYLVDDF